jgi:hypothetical protein
VAGFCEHGDEYLIFIEFVVILEEMGNSKKDQYPAK